MKTRRMGPRCLLHEGRSKFITLSKVTLAIIVYHYARCIMSLLIFLLMLNCVARINDDSKPTALHQSSDSETMLRESDDSFAQSGPKDSSTFSTPVRSRADNSSHRRRSPSPSESTERAISDLEKERAKLDRKKRKLDDEMDALEKMKSDLETREKEVESSEKRLREERISFERERDRKLEEVDEMRRSYESKLKRSDDANVVSEAKFALSIL